MKKQKNILIILSLFILLPRITYADCTKEEKEHFKEIENEYKITYEYNKDDKNYDVTFYNPEVDKYNFVAYIGENINCEDIDNEQTKCHNVPIGTYSVMIKGQTNTCNDILKEITLSLKKYNQYADDPLCEGLEDFVLCDPMYDKEIDYDTFVARINSHKKLSKIEDKKDTKNNQELAIINYLKNNLSNIVIIIFSIIALIITIILISKSIRKSRRLE